MSISKISVIVATIVLAALGVFQLLLAIGLPLGQFAWGGQHKGVLPASLRWSSLVAVPIIVLAAWIILARVNLVVPLVTVKVVQMAVWIFTGYFALNSVMNIMSTSSSERLLMTPTSAVLVACFFIVARS